MKSIAFDSDGQERQKDVSQRQGRSQEVDFFIIRGANYTNLYKNLIKI